MDSEKKRMFPSTGVAIAAVLGLLVLASVAFNPYCPMRGAFAGSKAEGAEAANFRLKDFDGDLVDFRQATEGKAVVLKFGALWCGWCQQQSEDFAVLQGQLDPEKAMIFEVSVHSDEPMEKVREKHQSLGLRHTVVRDEDNEAATKYSVSGLPAVFVIAPDGTIAYRAHYTPADRLLKEIEKALEGTKQAG